jgi:hypothetical protein
MDKRMIVLTGIATGVAVLAAGVVLSNYSDDGKQTLLLGLSVGATTFLTCMLVVLQGDMADVSREAARANKALADLAQEQRARNVAEFEVQNVDIAGHNLLRLSIVNVGWKDSALLAARFWPDGPKDDSDSFPVDLEILDGQGRGPAQDMMVRSGDQRIFCLHFPQMADAQAAQREFYERWSNLATVEILPAVGPGVFQNLQLKMAGKPGIPWDPLPKKNPRRENERNVVHKG